MVTSCPGVGLLGVKVNEGLISKVLTTGTSSPSTSFTTPSVGGVGDGDIRLPIGVHVSRFETHRSIEHAVSSVVLDGRIDGNGERTVINICIDRVVAADS